MFKAIIRAIYRQSCDGYISFIDQNSTSFSTHPGDAEVGTAIRVDIAGLEEGLALA